VDNPADSDRLARLTAPYPIGVIDQWLVIGEAVIKNVDYDKTDIARTYNQSRGYSKEQVSRRLAVISRYGRRDSFSAMLDLGCGTGRYSGALAKRFRTPMIGVDLSEKTPTEARKKAVGEMRAGVRGILAAHAMLGRDGFQGHGVSRLE